MLRSVLKSKFATMTTTTTAFNRMSKATQPCRTVTQQNRLRRLTETEAEAVFKRIVKISGQKNVSRSKSVLAQHGQDAGSPVGYDPDMVVFPASTEEVAEICKLCYAGRIPILPHGSGTGMEGGTAALFGGVCLDLTRNMTDILEYHPEDLDVAVRPGVTREALNRFVKNDGLWFPVDPGADASICGMCATSASGTNAMKYGTMKENCMNLEVVLSDGTIVHTNGEGKRPRKSAAGYNLTNLFVGSEGTLGVITKATVKLHPFPECIASAVVNFPTTELAIATVVAILTSSASVARMEYLDETSIEVVNRFGGLSLEVRPTLFLEFHGSEAGLAEQSNRLTT